jgi:hypothetical protein
VPYRFSIVISATAMLPICSQRYNSVFQQFLRVNQVIRIDRLDLIFLG